MRRTTIATTAVTLLLVAGCSQQQWGDSIPPNSQVLSIRKLHDEFSSYRGRAVCIRGKLYWVFPGDIFLNDGTGNMKVKFSSRTTEARQALMKLMKPRGSPLDPPITSNPVTVMGILDVDREALRGFVWVDGSIWLHVTCCQTRSFLLAEGVRFLA